LSSARVVAMALQFVAFASLAAHIAPAGIGIYSFAVAFVALFRIVPNFGFRTIVARDVAQQPEREADLIPNLAYLRAALGIVAYAALAGSLYLIGYSSESRRAALVAGLLLVLFTFESFLVVLEVRLKLAWAAWADVAEAVVLLAGFLVLVHLDAGVNRFLAMYVVANTLYGVIIFVAALRLGRYDWRLRLDVWRSLARAAAPVGLAALFIAL
jgi:O-antigen/teichoic acid export membrane protein